MTGDRGGDEGAGASASSSSSSPHSSSRRGVMLFPSHTEWMDTFDRHRTPGSRPGAGQQGPEQTPARTGPFRTPPSPTEGLGRGELLRTGRREPQGRHGSSGDI